MPIALYARASTEAQEKQQTVDSQLAGTERLLYPVSRNATFAHAPRQIKRQRSSGPGLGLDG